MNRVQLAALTVIAAVVLGGTLAYGILRLYA
jgi:ribose/xylose/arabinose/galactoside ABC-type transport system permease subunit